MEKDLNWYFKRIRCGEQTAEKEFLSQYQEECIKIIREKNIFFDKIPDIEKFTKETLESFITDLKFNRKIPKKITEKVFKKFIIQRVNKCIDTKLKSLCYALQKAEQELRKCESSILRYIESHKYCNCLPDHTTLADKICDEWVEIARRKDLAKIKSFIAFFIHNINQRMKDEIRKNINETERIKRIMNETKPFLREPAIALKRIEEIEKKSHCVESKLKCVE